MMPRPTRASPALQPRNATEDAILAAARRRCSRRPYDELTMDAIARRAFVSRTTVYFYFDNKRALVDRLIQRAFADMLDAAAPYLDGERRAARSSCASRWPASSRWSTPTQDVLLLAAELFGRRATSCPPSGSRTSRRFVADATGRIRARPGARHAPPTTSDPRISAQALCAMVERHVDHGDHPRRPPDHRVDPRAVGAVVAPRAVTRTRRGAESRGSRRPRARSRR